MRLRRIARQETDGTIVPLASTYNGKKFNSPNDIAIKSDGSIFFTDPDFNIPYPYNSELGFRGIYRISLSGTVQLLDSTFDKPNGICFSQNETKLYVNDSPKRIIYVWDIIDDSTITNKREFARITPPGYADGMKVDTNGNLFCTGPLGVWVFSPEGTVLDTILVPGQTSNCNWGDDDRKALYITAGNNVYRYRLPATSVKDRGTLPEGFELYQNYPNPFNPTTTLSFTVAHRSFVSLKIYDVLGKEVATLINEERTPGEYEKEFNTSETIQATSLPSGIYFYQLQAGNPHSGLEQVFLKTMKMLLIK
jgi:gluconolactonase